MLVYQRVHPMDILHTIYLVGGLEHSLFFHSVGTNHPNWRTPSFFRGVGIPPTRYPLVNIQKTMENHNLGKLTISMAIFNRLLYVYQAGYYFLKSKFMGVDIAPSFSSHSKSPYIIQRHPETHGILMYFDVFWCILIVFWCILMYFDVFWCILMVFWCILMVFWCILMYFDVFWCILMVFWWYFDVFWCILMYFGISWNIPSIAKNKLPILQFLLVNSSMLLVNRMDFVVSGRWVITHSVSWTWDI